jgi:hypothetical protein
MRMYHHLTPTFPHSLQWAFRVSIWVFWQVTIQLILIQDQLATIGTVSSIYNYSDLLILLANLHPHTYHAWTLTVLTCSLPHTAYSRHRK